MKANKMQKRKMTGNGFLLLITIVLFFVMYIAVSYTHLTLPTIRLV